jgi:hypothetical protein
MRKRLLPVIIGFLAAITGYAQEDTSVDIPARKKNWQIEPIKITSLMVNTHPEYNGWGLEAGRRITDKLWITSMIEKTLGGDFASNFDPNYDYLITFKYFAWLNTLRFYLKPEAVYTTFFDGGVEFQSASHKFLRNNWVFEENAYALGPLLFIGGEWHFYENIYFKWRMGGFINVYRSGSMKSRIDDGQDQPSFYLYPHLSDAVISSGSYAGDVAFGIKF